MTFKHDTVILDKVTRATPATPNPGRRPAIAADEVLDIAETLLDDGGFDALSVRRIADAAGASRQVVYTNFGGMDGLLDGLHRRLSTRLASVVDGVEPDPGTLEHILDATASYRTAARRWPHLYQLAFERPVADYAVGPEALADGRRSFGRIVQAAAAWLTRRDPATPPTEQRSIELARTLWSTTHGFVVLERVGFASTDETDDLSDRAIRALLMSWE